MEAQPAVRRVVGRGRAPLAVLRVVQPGVPHDPPRARSGGWGPVEQVLTAQAPPARAAGPVRPPTRTVPVRVLCAPRCRIDDCGPPSTLM